MRVAAVRGARGLLTQLVHTHSLRSCSLQLEKVVVEPAQVLAASLPRKPDVEVGTAGPQDNAVLERRWSAQREDVALG